MDFKGIPLSALATIIGSSTISKGDLINLADSWNIKLDKGDETVPELKEIIVQFIRSQTNSSKDKTSNKKNKESDPTVSPKNNTSGSSVKSAPSSSSTIKNSRSKGMAGLATNNSVAHSSHQNVR